MIGSRLLTVAMAGLLGAGLLCPVCGTSSAAAGVVPATYVETDVAASPSDTARARLEIEGMTCGSCATTARVVLEHTAGVIDADVSYEESSAEVTYDPELITPEEFIARLEEMTGYKARVVEVDEDTEGSHQNDR
jgi:copper chaperone CopZ